MVYYRFSEQDNESYAFREIVALTEHQRINQTIVPDMSGKVRTDVARCSTCGELLNKWSESLVGLRINKRKYDLSSTYDGVIIVSEKFKSIYEYNNLSGCQFVHLPDDNKFYYMKILSFVKFDVDRRIPRMINMCPLCKRYKGIFGPTPLCLQFGETIQENEIVRTDLEFGDGDEKSPLLLCAESVYLVLKKAKLKGVDLFPCE